jgi:dsDNA-binding SOS-regulon protein
MFTIYAEEMKSYRTGEGNIVFLKDDEMFDVYMKMLDKKDKIKSLYNPLVEQPETASTAPIRNLQDFALQKKKA